jgi:hypothetical protein
MHRSIAHAVALLALCAAAGAQEEEAFQRLPLRVTAAGPGAVVEVDRGSRDGLEVGDVVVLRPRESTPRRGKVAVVLARSATVELLEPGPPPPEGTRGEALLPAARLAPKPPAEPLAVDPELEPEADLPWRNSDEAWLPGQPLLGGIVAQKPEERPPRLAGRAYLLGDGTWVSDEDRSFTFVRGGASLALENLFGMGGVLELDAEGNYRTLSLPDDGDDNFTEARVDQLSYAWGGTRFAPVRIEVGRFWQHEVPELGLLDGVSWSRRRGGGDGFGLSLGFAPEPDADLDTGEDLQIAGWYRWVADESERLSATAAYQKTWHNGAADRDLVVAKAGLRPVDGWDVSGTAWIDLYTGGDDGKGSGLELTQANLRTGRRFESGDGIDLTYTRTRFPEVDANLFLEPAPDELFDSRYDRVSLSGWHYWGEELRLHSEVGAWDDEDESGGDAELGFELAEFWLKGGTAALAVFGTEGEFTTTTGARVGYSRYVERGSWDLSYQFAHHDNEGFEDDDIFELPQHRVRAGRSFHLSRDWHLSIDGGFDDWDQDSAWSAGFYLQRSF